MKPGVGDRLELEVSKVVHGGLGLARHEGFVLFVKGTLPGETVVCEVTHVRKNHAFADLLEVTSPSSHRVRHIWPKADYSRPSEDRAGGADFGHIERGHQLEIKAEILQQTLRQFAGMSESELSGVHVTAPDGDCDGLHWRTRVTLHVDERGRAGPRAEGSHRVIPVSSLPLATEALNRLGAHTSSWEGHHSLRLVDSSEDGARMVIDRQTPQRIRERVGDHVFELSDQGFWQVHHAAASTLHRAVSGAVRRHTFDESVEHLDLYGGVGLFATALLDGLGHGAHVVSVEADADAVSYAQKNLSRFHHAQSIARSTEAFVSQVNADSLQRLGVVVLDPPRAGAGQAVVTALMKRTPQLVVYVACDPVALARDISHFTKDGYRVESVSGFDLFPHTHHMEAIATLVPVD